MGSHTRTTAIVTGAARGIGRATAERLAADGYALVLNDLEAAPLGRVVDQLTSPSTPAIGVVGDVGDPATGKLLRTAGMDLSGGIDALVNNAAAVLPRRPLDDHTPDVVEAVFRTNVLGVHACTYAIVSAMRERPGAAIVNVSSIASTHALRGNPAYAASKGAVSAYTRALALDLAPVGIRVNAVAPGMIETEAWAAVTTAERTRRNGLAPLARPGQPGEIAAAIAFLLSADASYVTGQSLHVDGGLSVQAYTAGDEEPFFQ